MYMLLKIMLTMTFTAFGTLIILDIKVLFTFINQKTLNGTWPCQQDKNGDWSNSNSPCMISFVWLVKFTRQLAIFFWLKFVTRSFSCSIIGFLYHHTKWYQTQFHQPWFQHFWLYIIYNVCMQNGLANRPSVHFVWIYVIWMLVRTKWKLPNDLLMKYLELNKIWTKAVQIFIWFDKLT
jgi:hypothetical protein